MTPQTQNSSLLGNGYVNTFPRKRTRATIEEAVFSVEAVPRLYNEDLRLAARYNFGSFWSRQSKMIEK
jgi:hypothetical protein